MNCDVGEATEGLENELWRRWSDGKFGEWAELIVIVIAELILQAFHRFTYVTTHSPTLPSLYLRHISFSNPFVASPTSQLILQPFFRFSYATGFSLTSPGEPPMGKTKLSSDIRLTKWRPSNNRETISALFMVWTRKGHGKNDIIEDLNLLGSHMCSRKQEIKLEARVQFLVHDRIFLFQISHLANRGHISENQIFKEEIYYKEWKRREMK